MSEAAFRASVRAWIADNAPWHLKDALERSPPGSLILGEDAIAAQKDWQKRKYQAGYACLAWPKVYGGREASPSDRIIWHQEEGVFARLGALFHNGQTMGAPTLMKYAPVEILRTLLPRIASGEDVWCQLFSEPAAGSDLAGIRTRAERIGDRWRINGQKLWTSGGHYADYGVLIARSDPTKPKHKGLTAFFVDMRAKGVTAHPIRQMNNETGFAEVFFEDVMIDDSQRLGAVDDGWATALTMLSYERMAIGLEMPTGFEELWEYCSALETKGGPALEDPRIQMRLAEFEANARGLGIFTLQAMGRFAKGEPPGPEASIVKLAAGRMMQEIAAFALDLQAEAGILVGKDEPAFAGRFQGMCLRAPATRIEGGSDQILRNIIAERVLGMPADVRVDKDRSFDAIERGQ